MTRGRAYGLALALVAVGGLLLLVAGLPGWLFLAAVGGIVATGSWGRVVVAVLTAAGGAWALAWGIGQAGESPGGAVAAVAGGALIVGGAAWTAVRGRGWPTMGSRYDRDRKQARRVSDWDAQDMGKDPTDDLVE